jgi:hypothetical protein
MSHTMISHTICKEKALGLLEIISYRINMLKDMAHDGCTVTKYLPQLEQMEQLTTTIRRELKGEENAKH